MNWQINSASEWLNTAECTSLKADNIDEDEPGGAASGASADGRENAGRVVEPGNVAIDFSGVAIEALARSFFVDTMLMEVADFYSQDDVNKLIGMLKDEDEAEYHQTITGLIAMISDGSDAHAQALIDYADSRGFNAASAAAVVNLGMIANRGSDAALTNLMGKSDNADLDTAELAIAGLGLSGRDRAAQKLDELADSVPEALASRSIIVPSASTPA